MRTEGELFVWAVGVLALALVVYAWVRARRQKRLPEETAEREERSSSAERRGPSVSGGTPQLPPSASAPELTSPPAPLVGPVTRHPIVLAHGYMGFASIGVLRLRQEYFRGIRLALEARGYSVWSCSVSPAASIRRRAEQMAEQIDALPAARVNVIAHSMGGLDARYAISVLGLSSKVASLTTIGAPHHGTPLADSSALLIGDWRNVRRLLDRLGANVDGLYDLTTRRMEVFNAEVVDADGVDYASYVGAIHSGRSLANPILARSYAYLSRTAGDNDGLVPAWSQRWGAVLGHVAADHWAQIGWSRGFDARSFYAAIARGLTKRGL